MPVTVKTEPTAAKHEMGTDKDVKGAVGNEVAPGKGLAQVKFEPGPARPCVVKHEPATGEVEQAATTGLFRLFSAPTCPDTVPAAIACCPAVFTS